MLQKKKILIADDEPDIIEILQFVLEKDGYWITTALNGIDAINKAKTEKPDLIILDMMMPYKSGIEVCEHLRTLDAFKKTIIIILTALKDDTKTIKSLESGADDYINKPISPQVLTSKVNALFRRIEDKNTVNIKIGDLEINREKHSVKYKDRDIALARKEFELLFLLASNSEKLFLRNEILEKIWGTDIIVGDRTIDVHIRKIRQKIGFDCINTVKGLGYKFKFKAHENQG